MTRLVISRTSEEFFDGAPYPVDLSRVEARDGLDDALTFLRSRLPRPPAAVLDLGCGHGRHAGPLAAVGYDVTGVDLSRACLDVARRRYPAVRFIRANTARMPLPAATFDAAISIYSSLGLHEHPALDTLREAARVTRPGGTLLIDVVNAAEGLRGFVERVPRGFALGLRRSSRHRVTQHNLVISTRIVGLYRLSYSNVARELTGQLQTAGWTIEGAYGDFKGTPFDRDCRRLLMHARRRDAPR